MRWWRAPRATGKTEGRATDMRAVAVGILLLFVAVAAGADTPEATVLRLVRESQELADAGDLAGARAKLDEAAKLAPAYPAIYANLGYLCERQGETLHALDNYARVLELRPDDEYARTRIRRIFLGGPFPTRLRTSLLRFSPVSFVTDECLMRTADGTAQVTRRLAYTTGLLYPDEMGETGEPLLTQIPSAGGQGVVGAARFNRVCYGFVAPAGSEDLDLSLVTYYPSALLSEKGADYSGLAARLTHVLLRMLCYSRFHLALPPATQTAVPKVWLCETGPTGAEQYLDNIFFYDVGRERKPVEWLREAAHEWGHRALPKMGRFHEPEAYAEGMLGELIFLQYLAEEAGMVTGAPWPSEAAQMAVQGLWGSGQVDLHRYLVDTRRATVDFWLAQGPNSDLQAGLGREAFMYLIGAMAWVGAAHGDSLLAATLAKAPGESPADFYYGYRQAIKEAARGGEIALYAGALNLGRSKLSHQPVEGAQRREEIVLEPGDLARYPIYLLDGPAHLRITPGLQQSRLTGYLDGIGPLPIEAGTPVQLGTVEQGWHELTLTVPEDAPAVQLRAILIRTGPAQNAPDLR